MLVSDRVLCQLHHLHFSHRLHALLQRLPAAARQHVRHWLSRHHLPQRHLLRTSEKTPHSLFRLTYLFSGCQSAALCAINARASRSARHALHLRCCLAVSARPTVRRVTMARMDNAKVLAGCLPSFSLLWVWSACVAGCNSCTNGNSCSTTGCAATFVYQSGQCVCPTGTFLSNGVCEGLLDCCLLRLTRLVAACESNCDSCTSLTACSRESMQPICDR